MKKIILPFLALFSLSSAFAEVCHKLQSVGTHHSFSRKLCLQYEKICFTKRQSHDATLLDASQREVAHFSQYEKNSAVFFSRLGNLQLEILDSTSSYGPRGKVGALKLSHRDGSCFYDLYLDQ